MVENTDDVKEIVVDVNNIDKYIGHPIYKSSKFYGILPPPVRILFNQYLKHRELLLASLIMIMAAQFFILNQPRALSTMRVMENSR